MHLAVSLLLEQGGTTLGGGSSSLQKPAALVAEHSNSAGAVGKMVRRWRRRSDLPILAGPATHPSKHPPTFLPSRFCLHWDVMRSLICSELADPRPWGDLMNYADMVFDGISIWSSSRWWRIHEVQLLNHHLYDPKYFGAAAERDDKLTRSTNRREEADKDVQIRRLRPQRCYRPCTRRIHGPCPWFRYTLPRFPLVSWWGWNMRTLETNEEKGWWEGGSIRPRQCVFVQV